MPFTVSCTACDSRFLLGDDLFRRKVSGKVVTVRCRNCNAEIAVDATEPATLPSHEPPRRQRPAPPRPKHKEGESATQTPFPGSATVTPLPASALLSIWDAAEKKVEGPRKPPPPRPFSSNDGDFIEDIEEAPPSSSDAPSLNALKNEASPRKPVAPHKKAPDDFLVNLSAGTGGILGAPTIDVMGLASPPAPDVEELLEVEATELTPHAGTVPLFDMSAVLPVANGASKSVGSSLSPSHLDLAIDVEMPHAPSSEGKLRERKYVVAPATREEPPAPKTRRAGAAVWFVLVAAAAGVLAVVGVRGHHHATSEQPPNEHPQAVAENAPGANTAPAAPAVAASVIAEGSPPPSAPEEPSADSKPVATATPAALVATPGGTSTVKSADTAKPSEAEKPAPVAAPALEKPVEAEKPAEAEKPSVVPATPKPEPAEPGTEFDRSAAIAALKAAAAEAASCRKDGDPSGTATLTITFAPSGRVTSANIQGPPFAGTPTGGCIANAMRHAHVPAFSGDRVTVNKTIAIE